MADRIRRSDVLENPSPLARFQQSQGLRQVTLNDTAARQFGAGPDSDSVIWKLVGQLGRPFQMRDGLFHLPESELCCPLPEFAPTS